MGVLGLWAAVPVPGALRRAGAPACSARSSWPPRPLRPGRAPGHDRHGVRRTDDDGAGAGGAGALRRSRRRAAAPQLAAAFLAAPPLSYVRRGALRGGGVASADRQRGPAALAVPSRPPGLYPGHRGDGALFGGFRGFLGCAARLRYRAPLYLFIAATLCGLAMLAKGLAGLGLPVIIFLAYLLFTWNWKRLARADLGSGVLLAFMACGGGGGAVASRHADPLRLPLLGRAVWRQPLAAAGLGRHGDRGTFEYFVRELGYAHLAVDGAGARGAGRRWPCGRCARSGTRRASSGSARSGSWPRYTLVSLSVTKFHHYILPAIPGWPSPSPASWTICWIARQARGGGDRHPRAAACGRL